MMSEVNNSSRVSGNCDQGVHVEEHYFGNVSAEEWVAIHTQPWAQGREASSELWKAFQETAPAAANNYNTTSFGKIVASKYGAARVTKVRKKTTRWFTGVRLLLRPDLNQSFAQGYKFLYTWDERCLK